MNFGGCKQLEVMNFGGCEIEGYGRPLYRSFLEVMNVFNFGGCNLGGYERRL